MINIFQLLFYFYFFVCMFRGETSIKPLFGMMDGSPPSWALVVNPFDCARIVRGNSGADVYRIRVRILASLSLSPVNYIHLALLA